MNEYFVEFFISGHLREKIKLKNRKTGRKIKRLAFPEALDK